MKLTFELRPSYGRLRYYPINALADALVALTERKCLREDEIEALKRAGFKIEITKEIV